MLHYELFEVGGKVRDELLGRTSKDVDYTVVLEDITIDPLDGFLLFRDQLKFDGFKIHQENPDVFTIRAKFPKDHMYSGDADFVLARKEIDYIPGTRRPNVKLGTIFDDLERRDFTVNSMARLGDGSILDPFNGKSDLHYKILDTPIDPCKSFKDDPLRILRALRFCVTKGFTLAERVKVAIKELSIEKLEVVSAERIQAEMTKAFNFDTIKTLEYLNLFEDELNYPLRTYIFKDTGLRIMITNKKAK